MEYDPVGKGRIRDTIQIDEESQIELIKSFKKKIIDINKFLKEAYDHGDVIQAVGGMSSHSDGPFLSIDIEKVYNGFWKEKKGEENGI